MATKRFVMTKPKSRFHMTEKQLLGEHFQTLAHWLKEDFEILFLGMKKTEMAKKLTGLYAKARIEAKKARRKK